MWLIVGTVIFLALLAWLFHDRDGLDYRRREIRAAIAAREAQEARQERRLRRGLRRRGLRPRTVLRPAAFGLGSLS
ncbi:MAG: hypothetical protein QM662_09605 [Gordonia sp. (in: high G+C Gram-positive bacteria)]